MYLNADARVRNAEISLILMSFNRFEKTISHDIGPSQCVQEKFVQAHNDLSSHLTWHYTEQL